MDCQTTGLILDYQLANVQPLRVQTPKSRSLPHIILLCVTLVLHVPLKMILLVGWEVSELTSNSSTTGEGLGPLWCPLSRLGKERRKEMWK